MDVYRVERVIDGDTFEVSPEIPQYFALKTPMQEDTGMAPPETAVQRLEKPKTFKKVRLANINALEKGTPQAERATRYLKGLIEGKRVTLMPIEISYDCIVANVRRYPHHALINAILVYSGYANWTHYKHTENNGMYHLSELPARAAEHIKISLGPELLLEIDNDKKLQTIVLDAAGHEAGVLLDRIRDTNKTYFDSLDTDALQKVMGDILNEIFEKALDESTIAQAICILKNEQELLRHRADLKS